MCVDTGWVIRELSSRLEVEVTEHFTSSDAWRVEKRTKRLRQGIADLVLYHS